jgi:type IV secretion system protein VirB1
MLEFGLLAQQCAPTVAPQTMAAIVKTESGFRPLAIGVNGGARLERQPASKEEAVVTAKWLISSGYNIDLGLGQINSSNLARTGLSVEDAFDPCRNLGAAAQILTGNYLAVRSRARDDQQALYAAFSTYNTGSPTSGFANGYVQRVLANGNALDSISVPENTTVKPIQLMAKASAKSPVASAAPISKAKTAPLRLKAEDNSESEILKLMADAPGRSVGQKAEAPGQRMNHSVYERDARSIDVYR